MSQNLFKNDIVLSCTEILLRLLSRRKLKPALPVHVWLHTEAKKHSSCGVSAGSMSEYRELIFFAVPAPPKSGSGSSSRLLCLHFLLVQVGSQVRDVFVT